MSDVRFVYFDLDDTLLDHRHAERQALADLCQTFGDAFGHLAVETVQETYHVHNVALWRQYAEGRISRQDLRRLRFEKLVEALALDGVAAGALNDCYLARYARHWTLGAGAREAFFAIADRIPVGVLTNGFAEIQHAKLDRFSDLRARLQVLVISEEVGYLKPHPQIFAHAAERAGTAPEAILYVGDSYESDVQGALGAGWQAAWYRGADDGREADGVFRFYRWETLVDRLALGSAR